MSPVVNLIVSTFRNVTLVGLWLMPIGISLYNHFWRMIAIWVLFSVFTSLLIRKALEKPIHPTTPRQIYIYFYRIYQFCSSLAAFGYFLVMVDYVVGPAMKSHQFAQTGLLLVFYGVYFGVLGRAVAELCADWMAAVMGFTGKKEELPEKAINLSICGICGGKLLATNPKQTLSNDPPQNIELDDESAVSSVEKTVSLACKHPFHEWCIRGWTIVGKKDVCPYCCEKVDLTSTLVNPWERPTVLWGQVLDAVRYLIVWNPLILIAINALLSIADPVHNHHNPTAVQHDTHHPQ